MFRRDGVPVPCLRTVFLWEKEDKEAKEEWEESQRTNQHLNHRDIDTSIAVLVEFFLLC
jgi:hypothetical protein